MGTYLVLVGGDAGFIRGQRCRAEPRRAELITSQDFEITGVLPLALSKAEASKHSRGSLVLVSQHTAFVILNRRYRLLLLSNPPARIITSNHACLLHLITLFYPRRRTTTSASPSVFPRSLEREAKVAFTDTFDKETSCLNDSITQSPVPFPPIYHYLAAQRTSKDDSGVT